MDCRPPSAQELAATYDLIQAWEVADAAGGTHWASYDNLAASHGISDSWVYWSPAQSRWWESGNADPLWATGFCREDESAQFGWLVPQEQRPALLVASDDSQPRTGPDRSDSRVDESNFGRLMGNRRGLRPDSARDLRELVPWLRELDAGRMARLDSIPGCERRGFNVRAVQVMTEEADGWFSYEVYPRSEPSRRRGIVGVVELDPPGLFIRPLTAPL